MDSAYFKSIAAFKNPKFKNIKVAVNMMNIYKEILKKNLPRIYNLYNLDRFSSTAGCGDREYWGWKTKDFANATMQGGVHALAIAYRLGLAENKLFILNIVDAAIGAIASICARNGSVVEAYPNENSFCVTALVAFDILSAIHYLGDELARQKQEEYFSILQPLIHYINKHDEKHAIISNHLATGAGAISLWKELTGAKSDRDRELLDIIYRNQSPEGWYREYEGADPGYQTLCTYYLSRIYELTKDETLRTSLEKSLEYLQYFMHPDGSIGGLYGSRNTEVLYPGGLVALSEISDVSAAMIKQFQRTFDGGNNVLPEHIDTGNYVTLVNSYASAALSYEKNCSIIEKSDKALPINKVFEKKFTESGIYIKSTAKYYAIINYKKGGTIKVFNKKSNTIDMEDGGLAGEFHNGIRITTQMYDDTITFENTTLRSRFYKVNEAYPTPLDFILLRALSLTIFRSVYLGEMFKRIVVKRLMTAKKPAGGGAQRSFKFLEDKIVVYEKIIPPDNVKDIKRAGKTKAIHMASSGYYTKQAEYMMNDSAIVVFCED